MSFETSRTIAALLAGWIALAGCNATSKQSTFQTSPQPSPASAQVSIAAPAAVAVGPSGQLVLDVVARLHNPAGQPVQLFAGTPCAVFVWDVVAATDKIVQTKPSQLCSQVVAGDVLLPYSTLKQRYEVVLDGVRYRVGTRYFLRYLFWGHAGTHVFTLTDGAAHK